ncbi:MAG: glycosyltransferase family 4 protein [Planctomycetes bacterium]|nr:glycosyltransferase family 4 protein [Planctomycetota bacterium]
MKVLHLLPSLDYNSAARQVRSLAPALAPKVDLRICALKRLGPWANDFGGIPIQCLNATQALPIAPLLRLRSLLREFNPDRIHVWRAAALRPFAVMGRRYLPRVVVSQPLPTNTARPRLGKLDQWLLRRVDKVIAASAAEADRLKHLGTAGNKIDMIPPGVVVAATPPTTTGDPRSVVCLGALERHKGYEDALWAHDLLAFPHNDTEIRFIGAGPHRQRLLSFADSRFHPQRIQFLGNQPRAEEHLANALACWVPSLTPTGAQTVREALAAGCPVVAADWPELRELIADGENGYLFSPSDRAALARLSRPLLLDRGLRATMGQKAHQLARRRLDMTQWVQRIEKLYAGS